jgi:hypothetical protein
LLTLIETLLLVKAGEEDCDLLRVNNQEGGDFPLLPICPLLWLMGISLEVFWFCCILREFMTGHVAGSR